MGTAFRTFGNAARLSLASAIVVAALACNASAPSSTEDKVSPLRLVTAVDDWPTYGHDVSRTNCGLGRARDFGRDRGPARSGLDFRRRNQRQRHRQRPCGDERSRLRGQQRGRRRRLLRPRRDHGRSPVVGRRGHGPEGAGIPCGSVGLGSTAAVASGLLVVGGGDAAYYGLDASTGRVLWRHGLGTEPAGFAWSSPLLAGGRAYVGVASACVEGVRGELRVLGSRHGSSSGQPVLRAPPARWGPRSGTRPRWRRTAGPSSWPPAMTGAPKGGTSKRSCLSTRRRWPYSRRTSGVRSDRTRTSFATPIVFSAGGGRVLVGASHKTGVFYAYAASDIGVGPSGAARSGPSSASLPRSIRIVAEAAPSSSAAPTTWGRARSTRSTPRRGWTAGRP